MAYGVYSDRGYREHILERNKNTNKTEVFTQEDQTFTGRKTFLSGVTTSDLEVQTVEVSKSIKVKGKDITDIIGVKIDDEKVSPSETWSSEKINASLADKADKNAVLNSLEIVNGNTTAQIIPWNDGTHYRGYEDRSGDTYTDIITKDGVAKIAKIEQGTTTKFGELATMDKVVKDNSTAVEILYGNTTGAFLETDMNLTATKSGILKVSFNKKGKGNTFSIYINGVRKYKYANWWGENVYETAYVPVNKDDNIRITSDVSEGTVDKYRIVDVLII